MRDEVVTAVAELRGDAERERYFGARPELVSPPALVELCDAIVGRLFTDLDGAERLADTGEWLAGRVDDDFAWGRLLRTRASIAMLRRDYSRSVEYSEASLERFEAISDVREAAITRSSAVQSLINSGRYDQTRGWIEAARRVFDELGDVRQLAILDLNEGALLARQDRFEPALARFRGAFERFRTAGSPSDQAIALRNIAVCLQDLNDLEGAAAAYRRALEHSREHRLTQTSLELECNLSYLYFLRGDYTRALRGFELAREASEEFGDHHHSALSDLDAAEIYLELNLAAEAERLARQGYDGFDRLGMRYEAAKALAFEALAQASRGAAGRGEALGTLARARAIFAAEDNRIWPWRIDLHRALLEYEQGELEAAGELAGAALERLREVPTLAALCELLLTRIELANDDAGAALERAERLAGEIGRLGLGRLEFQAHLLRGQALERMGDPAAALAAFRAADASLHALRGRLVSDELKVAFLEDKQPVYENLVRLAATGPAEVRDPRQAFRFIEKAKARGLADLLVSGVQRLPARTGRGRRLATTLRRLRGEVGALQRRIDRAHSGEQAAGSERLAELEAELVERERELLAALRRLELEDREYGSLQVAAATEPESVQQILPRGTILLEYYIAGGRLVAAVLDRRELTVVPLADASRVEQLQESFRFQLAKFVAGEKLSEVSRRLASQAVEARLRALHAELIEPVAERLVGEHLVVVPHGSLHWLPFHALGDGRTALVDRFRVSYAPSAGVLALCRRRLAGAGGPALVLGVADDRAPLIAREARAVAARLPGSRLLVGGEASEEALRRHAPTARYVHIATHGFFRRDHPMFSAIQLADGRLSVLDLYGLELAAELVVLSGCSTGLNVVRAGDEQVGLTRGLLYAGARALLVSLWDVNDESTAVFMEDLYSALAASETPAGAVATATRRLRDRYPEPYYWAPFALTGWPFSLDDARSAEKEP